MDLGLADRVFIVTGGSSGLGRATAQALVDEGAKVVVSARGEERLAATVEGLGETAVAVVADNRDADAPARLVQAAVSAFGRLDGALLSVGGPPPGGVLDSTDDAWEAAAQSILIGGVRLGREIARAVGEGGSILYVLSTSVKAPIPGLAISNGIRPGLAMAAKTLADEVAPRGVRVNALLPGRFATERMVELEQATPDPAAARAQFEATIPVGRYGAPEEFGRTAAFVLSPAASYLTGVALPLDGGATRSL